MRKEILLVGLFTFLLSLTPVLAQIDFDRAWGFPDITLGAVSTFLGLPSDLVENPLDLVWYFVFPFISTLAIIFGILEQIKIFDGIQNSTTKSIIYFLIALGWAGLMIPTGIFGTVVLLVYGFAGTYSIVLFVILFIIGSFWWGMGFAFGSKEKFYNKRITDVKNRMTEQIEPIVDQVLDASNNTKIQEGGKDGAKAYILHLIREQGKVPAQDPPSGWNTQQWGNYEEVIGKDGSARINGAVSRWAPDIGYAESALKDIRSPFGNWIRNIAILIIAVIAVAVLIYFVVLPRGL